MNDNNNMNLEQILKNWRIIVIIAPFFAAITFFISTIITPQYKSEAQILILQKNIELDAYRAAKASEYAGEVIKRITGSSEFMNGVLTATGESSLQYGRSQEDQIKNWNKAVNTSNLVNTGIIKISVYDPNRKNNKKLMEAVLSELQNNGLKYHGNENIILKKISGPIYYDSPAYPIIWLNTLIAAIIGIFFSIGIIYLWGNRLGGWFADEITRHAEKEILAYQKMKEKVN